jgi:nucleoside-diphosphate-sugar epimerase
MSNGQDSAVALVTGAGGWLGRRLVQILVNGFGEDGPSDLWGERRVRCLLTPEEDDAPVSRLSDRVEILRGDLRNPADCERFCARARGGTLFHIAGVIHPQRVREFYDVNVGGTQNILQAAVTAGLRRAVIMSSNSPCGVNPTSEHRFDETSPYDPYMNYGRSKMLMEQTVQEQHARGAIETVVIRAPWFYGPYQPARQTLFFEMIRDGKGPIVGSGNNVRSMSYIDNLCQGLLLAEQKPQANGQTYWIADERPYTMNEVIDTVEKLLDTEFDIQCAHRRLRLPNFASDIAWLCDFGLQKLGLYHQKIHVLSEMNKNIACSIEKAKRELGYRPRIALEEGMRRSLAWCISQKQLGPRGPAPRLSAETST